MTSEQKVPLNDEQLEEFGNVAIDFFGKYLSKEELSALHIEVIFNSPKDYSTDSQSLESRATAAPSAQAARGSYRCRPGIDNGICEPGYRWAWGNP
jgi:hypothetical protein